MVGSAQVVVLEQQTNLNFFRGFEYDPTCDAISADCVCEVLEGSARVVSRSAVLDVAAVDYVQCGWRLLVI